VHRTLLATRAISKPCEISWVNGHALRRFAAKPSAAEGGISGESLARNSTPKATPPRGVLRDHQTDVGNPTSISV
jgi:hypothetical protein